MKREDHENLERERAALMAKLADLSQKENDSYFAEVDAAALLIYDVLAPHVQSLPPGAWTVRLSDGGLEVGPTGPSRRRVPRPARNAGIGGGPARGLRLVRDP